MGAAFSGNAPIPETVGLLVAVDGREVPSYLDGRPLATAEVAKGFGYAVFPDASSPAVRSRRMSLDATPQHVAAFQGEA